MDLHYMVLLCAFFTNGFADTVKFKNCGKPEICKVTQLRISPYYSGEHCMIRQNTNIRVSFDFTPEFSSKNLKSALYWDSWFWDIRLTDFMNACSHTSCPTKPGYTHTLSFNHSVKINVDEGTYNLKWKLWDDDNWEDICCLKTSIIVTE